VQGLLQLKVSLYWIAVATAVSAALNAKFTTEGCMWRKTQV